MSQSVSVPCVVVMSLQPEPGKHRVLTTHLGWPGWKHSILSGSPLPPPPSRPAHGTYSVACFPRGPGTYAQADRIWLGVRGDPGSSSTLPPAPGPGQQSLSAPGRAEGLSSSSPSPAGEEMQVDQGTGCVGAGSGTGPSPDPALCLLNGALLYCFRIRALSQLHTVSVLPPS